MRFYINYIVLSLLVFFIIMFYYGVSAGFENYMPVLALIGSFLLFVIAAPIIVYQYRLGVMVGSVGCVFIVPYSIFFLKGVLDDGGFNWVVILAAFPLLLLSFNLYGGLKLLLNKEENEKIRGRSNYKIFLSALPLLLFVLYIAIYGKYWF